MIRLRHFVSSSPKSKPVDEYSKLNSGVAKLKMKRFFFNCSFFSFLIIYNRSKSDARNLSCRTNNYATCVNDCWSRSTEDSIRTPIKRQLSNVFPPTSGNCPTAKVIHMKSYSSRILFGWCSLSVAQYQTIKRSNTKGSWRLSNLPL